MKKHFVIGKDSSGISIFVDLEKLLLTRGLIQANSGGGKSNTARVILEETYGAIQHIVIDPEGEFHTLRSKFDYVVFGGFDGDVPLTLEMAKLLPEKLLTLQANAILDLYALPHKDRAEFVKRFLIALNNTPRTLWNPLLVVIDESHLYCMDKDTEILTSTGWAKYNEVKVGDEVITFEPKSGEYKQEEIQRIIYKEYSGEMIWLKSNGIDQIVTPEHRTVIRRMQRAKGRKKKFYDWTFCEAEKVPTNVYIPIGGAPEGQGIPDLSLELLRLIGWIITDGSFTDKTRRYLSISQGYATTKRNKNMVFELKTLLEKFENYKGIRISERPPRNHSKALGRPVNSGRSIEVYLGVNLSNEILKWTGDNIHHIPRTFLQNCSKIQLEALYQGLLEGDGTSHNGVWTVFYPGYNERLADNFQELTIRLGISSTKKFVPQSKQWTILITRRRHHFIRKKSFQKYSGLVWDITVPSGAFIARRNGKVFVTGNCPQVGDSVSSDAVKTFVSQARKRNFCPLLLTQRVSKLSKDVTAECNNRFIGRAVQDVDMKRSGEELGINSKDYNNLRKLKTGEFYCFGPAINDEVNLIQIKEAQTKPPKVGKKLEGLSKPTEKILEILKQLSDLPKEAKEKEQSLKELQFENNKLKKDNSGLKRELELQDKKHSVNVPTTIIQKVPKEVLIELKEFNKKCDDFLYKNKKFKSGFSVMIEEFTKKLTELKNGFPEFEKNIEEFKKNRDKILNTLETNGSMENKIHTNINTLPQKQVVLNNSEITNGYPILSLSARKIIEFLHSNPDRGFTKQQISFATGYSHKSSGFVNALSFLNTNSIIKKESNLIKYALSIPYPGISTNHIFNLDTIRNMLGKCEREVFEVMLNNRTELSKEQIANFTESRYSINSSGFVNALSRLCTLKIFMRTGNGFVFSNDMKEML